jgi:hypothetical protein
MKPAMMPEQENLNSDMPDTLFLENDAEIAWQRAVQRQRELRVRELEQQVSRREEQLARDRQRLRREAYVGIIALVAASVYVFVMRRQLLRDVAVS